MTKNYKHLLQENDILRNDKKWMMQEDDTHGMDSGFTTFIYSSIP
jgi:hypothetical protein